jgi:chromosome segregation ATPase
MYSKIEKKILDLKQKEDFWRKGYKELSQQVKELVESNSRQMKAMGSAMEGFQSRMEQAEKSVKKTEARSAEIFTIIEKRLAELSENAKTISARIDQKDAEIKSVKIEVMSQVNALIAKHEKTFDSTVERIGLATKTLKDELAKQEGLYDRMESAKRFFESYRPPQIDASPAADPPPVQNLMPTPPAPERLPQAFIYEPQYSPVERLPPRRRRPVFDPELDDDMDVDDVISGRTESIKDSVNSMNTGMSGIAQKLASIEDSFSKMQAERNSGVDRLEDKIRMYSESVAGIHSRMGTLEKALKDGMTPMMETLKILTETVKTMKENQGQGVRKPAPPDSGKKVNERMKASTDAFQPQAPSISRRRA